MEQQQVTWAEHVKDFLHRKELDSAERTLTNLKLAAGNFTDFLQRENRTLVSILPADAKAFRAWLSSQDSKVHSKLQKLSINTVNRRVGRIRQIFEDALESQLIDSNPFQLRSLKVTVGAAKKQYISEETIRHVIASIPDEQLEWKLLFCFARWIGCRIPSEIRDLKWASVNWQEGWMEVYAPKTRTARLVPIFPEVNELLRQKLSESGGAEHIFAQLRHNENPATTAKKMVTNSGFEPWPKFWNALRASCETDLMDKVGIRKVVYRDPCCQKHGSNLAPLCHAWLRAELKLHKKTLENYVSQGISTPARTRTCRRLTNEKQGNTPVPMEFVLRPVLRNSKFRRRKLRKRTVKCVLTGGLFSWI